LDPRVQAVIFRMRGDHPGWGVRKIAAAVEVETGVSVSRETVRQLLRSAEMERGRAVRPGSQAGGQRFGEAVAGSRPVPGWQLAWQAREMTEADHRAFDAYRGAVYETPAVWWMGR
jgi:hypothetical protein